MRRRSRHRSRRRSPRPSRPSSRRRRCRPSRPRAPRSAPGRRPNGGRNAPARPRYVRGSGHPWTPRRTIRRVMPVPPTIAGPRARSRGRASAASLILLVAVVALATGLASTASAAPALPTCKVADTLTKQRSLSQWPRTVLDSSLRLGSGYAPTDLRWTTMAGLNGGERVRLLVIADLKAMATAARSAGARLAVASAFRSYTTQKATFLSWVRAHGYAFALKESARAG